MLDLLRAKGNEVLDNLSISKFAKIFVQLLKLDNLKFDGQGNPIRYWPTAMQDLISLPEYTSVLEHQKLYTRFIIKTLQIFDEEVVERSEQKKVADMQLSARIKDMLRVDQIPPVVTLLSQILLNSQVFETKIIKGALKALATLIDWNEI